MIIPQDYRWAYWRKDSSRKMRGAPGLEDVGGGAAFVFLLQMFGILKQSVRLWICLETPTLTPVYPSCQNLH